MDYRRNEGLVSALQTIGFFWFGAGGITAIVLLIAMSNVFKYSEEAGMMMLGSAVLAAFMGVAFGAMSFGVSKVLEEVSATASGGVSQEEGVQGSPSETEQAKPQEESGACGKCADPLKDFQQKAHCPKCSKYFHRMCVGWNLTCPLCKASVTVGSPSS